VWIVKVKVKVKVIHQSAHHVRTMPPGMSMHQSSQKEKTGMMRHWLAALTSLVLRSDAFRKQARSSTKRHKHWIIMDTRALQVFNQSINQLRRTFDGGGLNEDSTQLEVSHVPDPQHCRHVV
jgi:hypothetical protein